MNVHQLYPFDPICRIFLDFLYIKMPLSCLFNSTRCICPVHLTCGPAVPRLGTGFSLLPAESGNDVGSDYSMGMQHLACDLAHNLSHDLAGDLVHDLANDLAREPAPVLADEMAHELAHVLAHYLAHGCCWPR